MAKITRAQKILASSFRYMEAAHDGMRRLRAEKNGAPRSYDHHPLEVALVYAEMEVFLRRPEVATANPAHIADKIVDTVASASQMSKRELKSRLFALSGELSRRQLTTVVGLLCHDTIECSHTKDTPEDEKQRITARIRGEIRALRPGAEIIAVRLTDPKSKDEGKQQKRERQLRLSRDRTYAALKQYDILVNMYDEAQIPNKMRTRKKKRAALGHMRCFMRFAHKHGTISMPYLMAAERIYERSMAQLHLS